MYHSFLIHSSADGHLGCFHVLAIINTAFKNTNSTSHFLTFYFLFFLVFLFITLTISLSAPKIYTNQQPDLLKIHHRRVFKIQKKKDFGISEDETLSFRNKNYIDENISTKIIYDRIIYYPGR